VIVRVACRIGPDGLTGPDWNVTSVEPGRNARAVVVAVPSVPTYNGPNATTAPLGARCTDQPLPVAAANDTVTTTPGGTHTACWNWVKSKRTVVSWTRHGMGLVDPVAEDELVVIALGGDSCALELTREDGVDAPVVPPTPPCPAHPDSTMASAEPVSMARIRFP
jgi:hypothetical protein